jgi:hypothetical protein
MPDLFDTSQVLDDAAHWDALAERVAADAARESIRGGGGGLDWFAHSRASWVAASLLLAAALAFIVLPAEDSSASSFSAVWVEALAPADDVGRAIILPDGPPVIGALLFGGQGGGVR